jgi:hypothetical protein
MAEDLLLLREIVGLKEQRQGAASSRVGWDCEAGVRAASLILTGVMAHRR